MQERKNSEAGNEKEVDYGRKADRIIHRKM